MAGALALIGGGEFRDGCSFDVDLLADSGATDVVLVPTAAAYENPAHHVERARAWFAELGASLTVVPALRRADSLDPDILGPILDARIVYLLGGSAPHLRSCLKDTPLLDAISSAWAGGATLAASGAAAAALCVDMVDERGGAFTVGLGLVADVTVIPRYDIWSEDQNTRSIRMAPPVLPVLGIDERTAAIRRVDGRWSFQGAGRVQVFVAGHPVNHAVLS